MLDYAIADRFVAVSVGHNFFAISHSGN